MPSINSFPRIPNRHWINEPGLHLRDCYWFLCLLRSCLLNDANCCISAQIFELAANWTRTSVRYKTAHLSLTVLHNRRLISCKSQHDHVCLKKEDKGAQVDSAPPGSLTRIRTRRSCCRSGVGTWVRGCCTRTPGSQSRPSRSPWGTAAGSSAPGRGRSRLKERREGGRSCDGGHNDPSQAGAAAARGCLNAK